MLLNRWFQSLFHQKDLDLSKGADSLKTYVRVLESQIANTEREQQALYARGVKGSETERQNIAETIAAKKSLNTERRAVLATLSRTHNQGSVIHERIQLHRFLEQDPFVSSVLQASQRGELHRLSNQWGQNVGKLRDAIDNIRATNVATEEILPGDEVQNIIFSMQADSEANPSIVEDRPKLESRMRELLSD